MERINSTEQLGQWLLCKDQHWVEEIAQGFREVCLDEMKKEISKSQSWCFYHQRKQIFHKGLQDGCQNTSTCVGTWLQSSVWKCLARASCLGSHCSMYFTESSADWFLLCSELLQRYLGIWKLMRCLLLPRGFGSEVPCLVNDTSLEVSAGSHVPKYPVVWPKGKKKNTCLWSCSTLDTSLGCWFAKRPRGINMWLLEHILNTEWMWDAVASWMKTLQS